MKYYYYSKVEGLDEVEFYFRNKSEGIRFLRKAAAMGKKCRCITSCATNIFNKDGSLKIKTRYGKEIRTDLESNAVRFIENI